MGHEKVFVGRMAGIVEKLYFSSEVYDFFLKFVEIRKFTHWPNTHNNDTRETDL